MPLDRQLKKLFPGGVSNQHFHQSPLPNCQLLSVLYGLSRNPNGANLLEHLIRLMPSKVWVVKFFSQPGKGVPVHPFEVRKKPWKLEKDVMPLQVNANLGIRILEVAYARLMKLVEPEKYQLIPHEKILDVYDAPDYHRHSSRVMRDITGLKFVGSISLTSIRGKKTANRYLKRFSQHPESYVITLSSKESPGKHGYVDVGRTQIEKHAYTLEKVDWEAQRITYVNPHNTRVSQTVDMATFLEIFRGITILGLPEVKKALK